jgi:anion-transporting  ArsA/GET3 family ATPase
MTGPLDEILRTRRVVACVGSGGVGKTTLSAALGLRAAMQGRRTLILTIDPARRLANSLGLSTLGNQVTRIDDRQFAAAGLAPKGELWAMTLDLSRTWDDLVTRYAKSPAQRDAILGNRLYKALSTRMTGSLEYMAMEKVYELEKNGGYDLVLLDTPPTSHALDFLDAPNRLLDVFGNDAAKWLLGHASGAGKLGLSLVHLGSSYVIKTLSRFTGTELLQGLADFFFAFQGMYEGFQERAAATKELLSGPKSAFVLVTSPNPLTVDEAVFFAGELARSKVPVAAAVVNRVHDDPAGLEGARDPAELALALARARIPNRELPPHLSDALSVTIRELSLLAQRDAREIERFRAETGRRFAVYQLPRLARDVHDLAGLWGINESLRAPAAD